LRALGFSRNEWIAIVAIGLLTPLIDSRVEVLLPDFFYQIRGIVNVFDFTGGPVNSDLLVAWEEYGGVVAGYIVRKPGAATIAMTINGLGQFVIDGFQGPHHLLYGLAGVGADVGFALFRYRRYDVLATIFAGIMAQLFWIPVSYAYHSVPQFYSTLWMEGDFAVRIFGGALGDGLMAFAIGYFLLRIAKPVLESRRRHGKAGGTQVNASRLDNSSNARTKREFD
jgi:energy-coupling factor transport system substrate-specific component